MAFVGCALAAALGVTVTWRARDRGDPIVNGKRMSQWAFHLIGPNGRYKQKHSYYVPPEFREAFAASPEAAIEWLDRALNYRQSKASRIWTGVVRKMPRQISAALEPDGPVIANRWAAILALSTLAREFPDRRIGEVLRRSMWHSDARVRKVSAYEARPTLWPADPKVAADILSLAMKDSVAEVRRDACRRVLESAVDAADPYTAALRPLHKEIVELGMRDAVNRELIKRVIARFDSFWGSISPGQR